MADAARAEEAAGRTIYPEPMRMAEGGWKGPNFARGERAVPNDSDVEEEQLRSAREWLWHVENGRIGGKL